jgi:uncharacterized protein (TIGR02145 family)
MKKTIAFLFGILVFISCTTADTNDASGNPTTTVVPVAPTNLIATVFSANQVNLSWTDNSTNETGFKIERKTGTGTYTIVGSTVTDVVIFNDTGLTPSTTFIYRVYSYNAAGNSPTYSNEVTVTTTATTSLPTLTTTAVTSITTTTAATGGTISSDGGADITVRGVCWSTSSNPTIALTTKTVNGAGTGAFTSNITGLTAGTAYYVRAYATNSVGTAYGNEINFTTLFPIYNLGPNLTDIDGNVYASVINCGQTWTQRNLNVSKYSDGTPIPQVTDPTAWANLTTGAWCYYENSTANGTTYGKLYNWYAVAGIYDAASQANPGLRKKLAPTGWHIPSDAEWTQLTDCLGGQSVAGGKMKTIGTIQEGTGLWSTPNTAATNESGFTGLPAGARSRIGLDETGIGTFINKSSHTYWWSSSENDSTYALKRYLNYENGSAGGFDNPKWLGFSVRCLRD